MNIDEKIKEKIVLALDVEELDEAKTLVDSLYPYVGTFKVGLQLYTKYGSEVIDYISSKNSNFFLDVKLHDIVSPGMSELQRNSKHCGKSQ